MNEPRAARLKAPPTGVIETLSAGYAAVNRQLWVLLLPVLLDVFLWLGPHVSYAPLVDPAVTRASEWAREVTLGPRRGPRAPTPGLVNDLETTRQWVIERTDEVNGLAALAWGPLALPALGNVPSANDELAMVTGWPDGITLLVSCLGLSLLLGGWFYGGLAVASTGAKGGPLTAGRGAPRAVLDVLGLVGVLVATTLLLGVPVLLLIAFTALVAPPVALLGSLLVAVGVLFGVVHLFFAIDAIFVSHAGPLGAIQRSVGLVRRHPRSSVTLIALSWLILAGMARVWDVLAISLQSPYGVALGILGNAYIASGVIAAGMIFYTQRTEAAAAASAGIPT